MLSSCGRINNKLSGVAFLLLLFGSPVSLSQVNILDSEFTFRAGLVKTGNAFDIISRQTGYYFTFDSRLIDTEKKTDLSFTGVKLSSILDSLLKNDSLLYSVINKYIIIYSLLFSLAFMFSRTSFLGFTREFFWLIFYYVFYSSIIKLISSS